MLLYMKLYFNSAKVQDVTLGFKLCRDSVNFLLDCSQMAFFFKKNHGDAKKIHKKYLQFGAPF